MIYLIDEAMEQGAQQIVDQASRSERSHGVMVGIDPDWHFFYRLFLMNYDYRFVTFKDLEKVKEKYKHGIIPFYRSMFPFPLPIDITWRPPFWNEWKRGRSNLIIKVLLREGAENINFEYGGPLTIVQEQAPVPVLFGTHPKTPISPLEGGVSIGCGTKTSGTLGGIMREKGTSKYYGLTCGHVVDAIGNVVDQPAQMDDPAGYSAIGKCVFRLFPSSVSTTLCTHYDGTKVFHSYDLSLIELDKKADLSIINTGTLSGVTPCSKIGFGLAVTVNGKESNQKILEVGFVGITNNVKLLSGVEYCFEHLVELVEPSVTTLLKTTPTVSGDSGAWVIVHQSTTKKEWGGMLIGGDTQYGLFIMAEKIVNVLSAAGYNLEVC